MSTVPDWRRQMPLPGPFQMLVLSALVRLGPDRYGMQLHEHIEHRSGRRIAPQQVYTALARLEARGYVSSWRRRPLVEMRRDEWRPGLRERPVRPRVFHGITTLGRRALRLATAAIDRLRAGLPGLGLDERLYRHDEPRAAPPVPRRPWRPDAATRQRHEAARRQRWREVMRRHLARQRLLRRTRPLLPPHGTAWQPPGSRPHPPAA